MTDIVDSDRHCCNLVNKFDHDRYMTVLYAPEDKRAALYALYAFNYEISRIRETVSEPVLGEIRLQWWREAIDDIFKGKIRRHDVIPSLAEAVVVHDLSRTVLMEIIEGRADDLYDKNPDNMAALENYLSRTVGNLSCLAAHILGKKENDDLARRLGMAWGYVGLMRSITYHISLKKSYIPLNLIEKYKNTSRFLSPDNPQSMKAIVQEFTQQAERHLDYISKNKKSIDPQARALFLLSSLARSYMKSLKKIDYNVFKLEEKADAFFRQWRLLISALFNRI